MALQQIGADPTAVTYSRINAAIVALNKAISDILDLSGAEENAAAAIFNLRTDTNALTNNLATLAASVVAEAQARAGTDAQFTQSVGALQKAVADLQTALRNDELNLYPAVGALQIAQSALQELAAQASADVIEIRAELDINLTAFRQNVATLMQNVAARRYDFALNRSRPGEAPGAFGFTTSIALAAGPRAAVPNLPALLLASGDRGGVARVIGVGVLSMRRAEPLEPGRTKRLRAVVQRRTNVIDPSGDAVLIGLAWLDQAMNLIPGSAGITTVRLFDNLVTGDGRQVVEAVFSLSPPGGVSTIQAPASARFAVGFVQFYGPDGVTDTELLDIEDATAAVVVDPLSASVAAAVAALISVNPGPRLEAIESAIAAPNSVTFATKADAVAATIADNVVTVELHGRDAAGDGFGGLYKRDAGPIPNGADGFVSHGAVFLRVVQAQEAFNATITPLLIEFIRSLPESPPFGGGLWSNGGTISLANPAT